MKVRVEGKKLHIELDIVDEISSTGKSTLVASTRGYSNSDCEYEGYPIVISVNAIIKDKGEAARRHR